MSSEKQFEFTKENIDRYLKEVAKEYRKQAGKKMPAELVLIGGASVLINRWTTEIDKATDITSAGNDTTEASFPAFLMAKRRQKRYNLSFLSSQHPNAGRTYPGRQDPQTTPA